MAIGMLTVEMYVIYKYENVIRNNVNICNIHPMVDPLPLPQFRMSDAGSGDPGGRVPTPGGSGNKGLLMSRRPSAGISPGRLPTMRSRDLTLGGVKKVWHASVSLTHSLHLTTTTTTKKAQMDTLNEYICCLISCIYRSSFYSLENVYTQHYWPKS